MNPAVRGWLIILAIAGVVTAFSLQGGLEILFWVVRIVFIVAIALLLYRLWRSRREEIAAWPGRSKAVFYGGVVLALVNLVVAFLVDYPSNGLEVVIFVAVLVSAGYSMYRVWREQHTYGY
jgi:tellurite resistance protein TehA-like permease